jgi:trk system potassium uptake protein TrkA
MQVIVLGCGRMGAGLAYRLYQRGAQVTVIDQSTASFNNLHPEFRGRTVEGDALDEDVLRRAGIEQADALAAVSSSDSVNAVVAHVARTVYQVSHVAVRNYDVRWRQVHETFGLHVVSSTSWGAQRLEELLYNPDIRSVFSAGNGEVDIYEVRVTHPWHGRSLAELVPAELCIPAALTRAGRAMLPSPDLSLEEGDLIHVSATLEGLNSLQQRLNSDSR